MKSSIFSLYSLLFFFSLNAQHNDYKELMEQEWPQLEKYHSANQEIIKNSDWPDVVFMGNSITEGWANTHPKFFSKNNYVGRGIGGQTTPPDAYPIYT
ncbi:hypothetical protein [Christiangramia sp. SM2212]|uniref:G-D-S-L family lipolytic protein n=1 Tax=Christiangramia sediminicola TaxID=3073267 RepID=A0ABU1EN36_9FLAO|nr:hypothetical protein [Christiangramia sp. SM2212]MDR5589801.1 hypothetical protein [Christiangramia sp. SM2212]